MQQQLDGVGMLVSTTEHTHTHIQNITERENSSGVDENAVVFNSEEFKLWKRDVCWRMLCVCYVFLGAIEIGKVATVVIDSSGDRNKGCTQPFVQG
jgi:hypothetical protein